MKYGTIMLVILLTIHMINPDGEYTTATLGTDIQNGDVLQYVVPKGTIFASSIEISNTYSLVGCMCQPAFAFKRFELFKQSELITQYPHLKSVIEKYLLKIKMINEVVSKVV